MCGRGVRLGSAWSYKDIVRIAAKEWKAHSSHLPDWRLRVVNGDIPTNPSIELWDVMLKAGFPFLKKAIFTTPLLGDNLLEICNVLSARGRLEGGSQKVAY
jgi:hypothetical protein